MQSTRAECWDSGHQSGPGMLSTPFKIACSVLKDKANLALAILLCKSAASDVAYLYEVYFR